MASMKHTYTPRATDIEALVGRTLIFADLIQTEERRRVTRE